MWVASPAFSSLEVAVNVAFGTTPQRRFWLSRLKAFVALSGGVLLLGATVVAGHVALWLDGYFAREGAPLLLSSRARILSSAALVIVTFGVFTLFYKWLPSGKVAWWSAARAALVAVVLWEVARLAFGSLLSPRRASGSCRARWRGLSPSWAGFTWRWRVTIYGAEVAAVSTATAVGTKKPPRAGKSAPADS